MRRGLERPEVITERAMFLDQFKSAPGVIYGGLDFASMSYDTFVLKEVFDFIIVVFSDFVEIKVIKSGAEVFAFAQDGDPA